MRERFGNANADREDRIMYKNDAYGIRKDLFEYVISKHLPVHQQVLKILPAFPYSVHAVLHIIRYQGFVHRTNITDNRSDARYFHCNYRCVAASSVSGYVGLE